MKITTVPSRTFLSASKIPGTDYALNPYVGCPHRCLYCYAEYMRKFTGHAEPWGEFLDVKLCQTPLPAAKLFGRRVLLSSVTDPYNPFEKKYEVTRGLLKQLVPCRAQVSILTKSALVVRDMDLLTQLPGCEVAFSFSTADERVRQLLEPGASPVAERVRALTQLRAAGISTAVMAAPLLPGISDWKEIVDICAPVTDVFRFDSLNMRPSFQHKLMDFIDVYYPHLLPLYNEIYLQGKHTYWQKLTREIETYTAARGIYAEIYCAGNSSFTFTTPRRQPAKPLSPPLDEPQLF